MREATVLSLLGPPGERVAPAERVSLPQPAAAPDPGRRVLRAGTVRTVESVELTRAATESAAREEQELTSQLAAAREQGREQGRAQALAEGAGAVVRAAAALDAVHAAVGAQQQRDAAVVTGQVLALALQVAHWALRRELSADGSALLTRLESGLTALLPSPTTRISVSHADHALVSEWAQARGRVGTEVVADARLEPGDAVVVTDAGRAEVTVAAAVHAAAEALGLSDPGRPG